MANPTYPNTISGKYLSVNLVSGSVSTQIAGVFDWTITIRSNELDATTGATGGYDASDFGTIVAEGSFDLIQNLANGPFIAIAPGTAVYAQFFRSSGDTKPAVDCPVFNIFSASLKVAVKDRVTLACSGKSSGPFTIYNPGAT